jgi:hypothetical protein
MSHQQIVDNSTILIDYVRPFYNVTIDRQPSADRRQLYRLNRLCQAIL